MKRTRSSMLFRLAVAAGAAASLAVLPACGGGGGGQTAASATVPATSALAPTAGASGDGGGATTQDAAPSSTSQGKTSPGTKGGSDAAIERAKKQALANRRKSKGSSGPTSTERSAINEGLNSAGNSGSSGSSGGTASSGGSGGSGGGGSGGGSGGNGGGSGGSGGGGGGGSGGGDSGGGSGGQCHGAPVVNLTTPGSNPPIKKDWPITVTASSGGQPIRGHVHYFFLFNGQVVSDQGTGANPANFTGTFHDVINWPPESKGIKLTFRVQVKTPCGTKNVDYNVQVGG